MTVAEQLQNAVDEIREVCRKHGVVLIGTCESEGIYGEITIAKNVEAAINWSDPKEVVDNTVKGSEDRGFTLGGIGDFTGG